MALHGRVRRARTKFVTVHRREVAERVQEAGARGLVSEAPRRSAAKAELFEAALARVSAALASAARQSAADLRAERLAAARRGEPDIDTPPISVTMTRGFGASPAATPDRAQGRVVRPGRRCPPPGIARPPHVAAGAPDGTELSDALPKCKMVRESEEERDGEDGSQARGRGEGPDREPHGRSGRGQVASGDAVLVDLRAPEELAASDKVPGSVHGPRGMLEFRADPTSSYHDPALEPIRRVILHCVGGRSWQPRRCRTWATGPSPTSTEGSRRGSKRASPWSDPHVAGSSSGPVPSDRRRPCT